MEKGSKIVAKYKKLVSERSSLDEVWAEAYEYTYPLNGEGFRNKSEDGAAKYQSAKNKQAKLVDSTGTEAVRLLTASLLQSLTPKSSQWFSFTISDVSESDIPYAHKRWIQDSAITMTDAIHSSNYDSEALDFIKDIVISGMSGLYVDWRDDGGLYFERWNLYGMYVQDTQGLGRIDTVYRQLNLTVQQAKLKYGKLPQNLEQALKDGCNKPRPFVHCIRPRIRNGKLSQGKLASQFPFESVVVCAQSGEIVHEGGFQEFPVIIPRWSKIPDTEYAVGPFNDVLPDVKSLNYYISLGMENAAMNVSGTWLVSDDAVINPNAVKIGARKIIPVADVDGIKPLATGTNFSIYQSEVERLQRNIRRVMMSDDLSPAEQRSGVTATEITTRTQLLRQILAPHFGRMQSEFLDGLIRRVYGLLYRNGALGELPEGLGNFVPTYQTPIARAQKLELIQSIDQFNQRIGTIAQMKPEAMDYINVDNQAKIFAEYLAIPVEALPSDKELKQIREARAQAEQQQSQMAQMAQAMQQGGANGQQV